MTLSCIVPPEKEEKCMGWGEVILVAILIGAVALAVRGLKKEGSRCSGDCAHCTGCGAQTKTTCQPGEKPL